MCFALLQAGADKTLRDNNGETSQDLAESRDRDKIYRLLNDWRPLGLTATQTQKIKESRGEGPMRWGGDRRTYPSYKRYFRSESERESSGCAWGIRREHGTSIGRTLLAPAATLPLKVRLNDTPVGYVAAREKKDFALSSKRPSRRPTSTGGFPTHEAFRRCNTVDIILCAFRVHGKNISPLPFLPTALRVKCRPWETEADPEIKSQLRVLDMKRMTFGERHAGTHTTLGRLGGLCRAAGRLEVGGCAERQSRQQTA